MVIQTRFFPTRIVDTQNQTACIRSIFLDIPKGYPLFKPGQTIRMQFGAGNEAKALPLKPYCICSLPADEVIEICVDLVNEQGVSGCLHHSEVDMGIGITEPKGNFVLRATTDQPLIFIGFGSGIGVVRGFMRQYFREASGIKKPLHFYVINSDETSIPYEPELEKASDRYAPLEVYPILQTNGYDIDEIMDRILSHTDPDRIWNIYIAGPAYPVSMLADQLSDTGFHRSAIIAQGYD